MITRKIYQNIIRPGDNYTISAPSGEKIVYLGIQCKPGTIFSLNQDLEENSLIMVGATGVFELDLQNTDAYISSIVFKEPFYFPNNSKETEEAKETEEIRETRGEIIVDYITTTVQEGGNR